MSCDPSSYKGKQQPGCNFIDLEIIVVAVVIIIFIIVTVVVVAVFVVFIIDIVIVSTIVVVIIIIEQDRYIPLSETITENSYIQK